MFVTYFFNSVPNVTAATFEVQYAFRQEMFYFTLNDTYFWDYDEGDKLTYSISTALAGDFNWIELTGGSTPTVKGLP